MSFVVKAAAIVSFTMHKHSTPWKKKNWIDQSTQEIGFALIAWVDFENLNGTNQCFVKEKKNTSIELTIVYVCVYAVSSAMLFGASK